MIDITNINDKLLTDILIEIIETLNKHERYLEALQEAITMGGKVSKLAIDAFKEKEDTE